MHNSKLLQIFGTLSDKELKDFEKFLSFQVDESSNVAALFQIIKKEAPDYNSKSLEKKIIYSKIFQKKDYKDVKVRELMSLLRKIVERYFIYIEQNSLEYYKQLALLKQFRKRNLESLFSQQLKSITSLVSEDPFYNSEFNKRNFLLANERNNFFEQQQIRVNDSAISDKNDHFDKYYFSAKLRNLCELINREKILNVSYNKIIEKNILEIVEANKHSYLDLPSIHCYHAILLLIKTDNSQEQFESTFNTINQFQKSFTNSELKSLYAYLLNYCIQHVNKGHSEFTPKLFELQKLLLLNKILLENGTLSHISYRNIVSIAIKLKEYDWAEQFIADYKILISEDYQENAYNLSKSNLLYAQKDYNETVSLLNQVEFTDMYYACTAKFTLLKAYYALKEIETLEYFVSSFQLYLKRNKDISLAFKKNSENFLKHFKKLLLIIKQVEYKESEKVDKKIKDLIGNIKAEKTMANKAWLLEEIAQVSST